MGATQSQSISVVGGGFSGLVQAYYLIEQGLSVRVFEKESRLGGLLGSRTEKNFLIEQAANAFLSNQELEKLAKQIEVELIPTKKQARKRFIYRDGSMRRLPVSMGTLLKVVKFFLLRSRSSQSSMDHDETLHDWGNRVLGAEALQYLIEPAMQGIYASTSDCLDAKLILSSLNKRTPRGRMKGSVSPRGGMQEWVDQLKAYLVKQGCLFETGQSWQPQQNEKTILAVGLADLKDMAQNGLISLPDSIEKTEMASLSSVTLAFEKEPEYPKGFGCLFPQKENFNSLGVLFNQNIFPGRTPFGASETWILNDQKMEFSKMTESALLRYIYSDRSRLLKKQEGPLLTHCAQWSKRIPLYNKNLRNFNVDLLEFETPYCFVGNYLGSLGLSKILFRAKENAKKMAGREDV